MRRDATDPIRFPPFRLDPRSGQLLRGDVALPLRKKTFAVLHLLASRPGELVTKGDLLDAVWPRTHVTESVLSGCIRELRRVLGDSAVAPRFIETAHGRGYRFVGAAAAGVAAPPAARLVGRGAELAALEQCLEAARAGRRQLVFVTGEPGIGKTALVDAFLERLDGSRATRGQCVEHFGAGEAYLPLLEAFARLCAGPQAERTLAVLRRHAPTWLAQMPWLADADGPAPGLGATTPERMLREMAVALDALAADETLVVVLEDLHWSDGATVELLASLARRREPARLLVVGTYRPVEVVAREHPLKAVQQELAAHRLSQQIAVPYLPVADVAAYLGGRFPGLADVDALARAVHARTDGTPLFVVNVADYLVAGGMLACVDGAWRLTVGAADAARGVPESLRDMVAKQVERLDADAQRVLEAGSLVGRTFSAAAVAAALAEDVVTVEACCERLARRDQLLRAAGRSEWPDGTVAGRYEWIHALYEAVLAERVPPARRRQLHRRIGERTEAAWRDRIDDVASELAVHFEHGGDAVRAIDHLERAARRAVGRGAHHEAIASLERALAQLDALPAMPDRAMRALALHLPLVTSLAMANGFAHPEVEAAYTRMRAIAETVAETPLKFLAFGGLLSFYICCARHEEVHRLGDELLGMASRLGVDVLVAGAHTIVGIALHNLGDQHDARTHLEEALRHAGDPLGMGVDIEVASRFALAYALLFLGHPDQALACSRLARARADVTGFPLDRVTAIATECQLFAYLRDVPATRRVADELAGVASEYGFPFFEAFATIARSWAQTLAGGDADGAIAAMTPCFAQLERIGQQGSRSYLLGWLAEVYACAGRVDEALRVLAEAKAQVERTGERATEAELHRLEGVVRQRRTGVQARRRAAEATACFERAIAVARRQDARWWELRATIDLARLWQRNGRRADARGALAGIDAWFVEGGDTADRRAAAALLAELA